MGEFQLLGVRIRYFRKKLGLTQEELAEKCGIHYKFLGGIERGTQNPTLLVLSKITKALNVSLADIFDYELLAQGPKQVRNRLVDGLKKCSDDEIMMLYRVYRSL